MDILSLNVTPNRLFFGEEGHGISRYDVVRYPVFSKLNKRMRSLFWEPETVDVSGEKRSFDRMTPDEQFIFTRNLQRQILLDSVQGRAPMLVFAPHCTDPALENCLSTWSFFETIHSESYTHILRAIYPDPAVVVDTLPEIQPIADCAYEISRSYDLCISEPSKKTLYLALAAANALEAIRFYVSFACTFSLAERAYVEGSAKIVKYIARDETQHLALATHILKALPLDDPEFKEIAASCEDEVIEIFQSAADQEKAWARFLFQDRKMLGLNEDILCKYVDYLLVRRLQAIGVSTKGKARPDNPIPWMDKYLSSDKLQVAPQETEVASYLSATSLVNNLSEVNFAFLDTACS